MIDSITRITLNLQETNTMVSIRAKRGDTGRKLLIHLSDGSIPYHISDDCYATFTAKKPDGTKINNACTIENNVIEYEFTDQTCTAVGTMKAEIRLYGADDKMITSACFLVNVYDTVFRDGDEVGSETEMNTLDDLILRANAFLNETGKLLRWQGNWDSETEYEANDLVLHEEVLYVAEEAIAAGTMPGSEEVTAWVPIAGMGTGSGADLTEQVDRAETAAQNAESAAATANNARAQAQAAANSAGVYVGNAVAAMNNANAAAATAEAAKESVSTSVNLAGGYASTAHSSANRAEQANNSAQGYASSASSSATRAEEAAARAEEAAAEAGNGSGGNVDLTGYATEQWVKDQKYLTKVPEGYAKTDDIPQKPGDIGAQPSGDYALRSELPTVPVQSVNGKTGMVQLSASDVGARSDNWMPTAQEVGALPSTYTPPDQTAEQVGADPKGTAASAVSQHNTAEDSHQDIRLELQAINARLTAFFDSDNQTLDELSEIVAYITSNKTLIQGITISKVSVTDIINNLVTNVANKPLSAAQGVALKLMIDTVSNKLSNYAMKSEIPTKPEDIGAQPSGDYALRSEIPAVPVKSVNGKTGAVSLTAADVKARPDDWMPTASDVGALPDSTVIPTVPTNVSAFVNDAGYLTQHQDISGLLPRTELPAAIDTALAQAKESGKFDGPQGKTGNGIKSAVLNADYTLTLTFDDGTTYTTPSIRGADGKNPVKGVEYWTDADQEDIVQQVIAALGTPVFGRVEEGNKITVSTEHLADGTYDFGYEDKDGNWVLIGTIDKNGEDEPTYTNWISSSMDTDGSVYNGTGYKASTRFNSSNAITDISSGSNPVFITGFIPVKTGNVIRMKNCYIDTANVANAGTYGSNGWSLRILLYKSLTAEPDAYFVWTDLAADSDWANNIVLSGTLCTGFTIGAQVSAGGSKYIRLCLAPTTGNPADAIVTIDEEIV